MRRWGSVLQAESSNGVKSDSCKLLDICVLISLVACQACCAVQA